MFRHSYHKQSARLKPAACLVVLVIQVLTARLLEAQLLLVSVSTTDSLFDSLLLLSPLSYKKVTLVTPVKLMQYVRYLDIDKSATLQQFSASQARSPLCMKFGIHMSENLQSNFELRSLPSAFDDHGLHSSFLINYWDNFTSILISLAIAMLLSFLGKVAQKTKQKVLQSLFERLCLLFKYNFALLILAFNIDDLILFSGLELMSFSHHTRRTPTLGISLLINLIFIGITIALVVGMVVLIARLNNQKPSRYTLR